MIRADEWRIWKIELDHRDRPADRGWAVRMCFRPANLLANRTDWAQSQIGSVNWMTSGLNSPAMKWWCQSGHFDAPAIPKSTYVAFG